MTISHHLDEATILAYAAGSLDEAFAVVVASHVALCGSCRAAVRRAEAVGGHILEAAEAVPVSDAARARMLAQLDVVQPFHAPDRRVQPPAKIGEMPRPLARLLGDASLDDVRWKPVAPGISVHDLPLSARSGGQLRLLKIGPGRAMPDHGHGGEEITLVLRGAYRDRFGEFRAGDVADLDETVEHQPTVTEDGPCICLVATEAPTRMKSFIARLLQPLIGF